MTRDQTMNYNDRPTTDVDQSHRSNFIDFASRQSHRSTSTLVRATYYKMSRHVKTTPIGIDLGTTYSCVAAWFDQHNRVEIFSNEQGNKITPSCVACNDTEVLVGEGAKNQITANPTNTIFGHESGNSSNHGSGYESSHGSSHGLGRGSVKGLMVLVMDRLMVLDMCWVMVLDIGRVIGLIIPSREGRNITHTSRNENHQK
ncbi:hypothetical protein R6Q59_019644 [Mikania micrantha]